MNYAVDEALGGYETDCENKLAAESRVTPEELKFLFAEMPKAIEQIEREVWDEQKRIAYRQLLEEEKA